MLNTILGDHICDLNHLKNLAFELSTHLRKHDVVLLYGDLGVGKTEFARCLINTLLRQETEVTSPTFNIVQTYSNADITIWHFDLYRLHNIEEIQYIDLDMAFDNGITLIEWPEIVEKIIPIQHFTIHIKNIGHNLQERLVNIDICSAV